MHMNLARRGVLVLAAAGIALGTAAYASSASASTATARSHAVSTAVKPLKVALIAPSATNDLAFTQSMYSALESLKSSENLTISVSANEYVVSDAASIIREYASEGYNLIVAHGSQYGSTIEQLAPQFPKVSFAWGTAGATFGLKNVFAYEASSNEGGYVQGYMAALISKSKVLGICGPIATGDAKLYVDGFAAGAAAAAKADKFKVTAHEVYTGSFSDDSLMATCAKTFVSGDKADVLTGSSQSVVGAIGVAKTDHLAWFGTQWNQSTLAPSNVVSSQVYNWDPILTQMFTAIRGGTLGGATYVIGLGNNGEKIQFNAGYKLSPAIKAQGQKLITAITDGNITVPQ
jgi:basic membrane lipoprotein Med (substrate-binding protein (PBP1-ABC) superfamily)